MSEPWLYAEVLDGEVVELDAAESRHAFGSLRLRSSDAVTVFNGNGTTATGRLISRQGKRDNARVRVEHRAEHPQASHALTLTVSGCKGYRLSMLAEKCTELNVDRLQFAAFSRSVVTLGVGQVEKLRRTAIEACKQARRPWIPLIHSGPLMVGAQQFPVQSVRYVADLVDDAPTLDAVLSPDAKVVEIIIGPEGGLTDGERSAFAAAGVETVSLGPNVLRVETAAMAAAALWSQRVSGSAVADPTPSPGS